jgi:hypothetical protein
MPRGSFRQGELNGFFDSQKKKREKEEEEEKKETPVD